MRVVFIGSVLFSRTVLRSLSDLPDVAIVGIVTRKHSPHGSDFASLADDARALEVPCLEADETSTDDLADWIKAREPDAIFCIGWNRILPPEILEIATRGVIGYHPAALPQNRGRHPIIWALARGLTETASTFFLMDDGADTGPILDQEPVTIAVDDDAGTLYTKIQSLAPTQLKRFVPRLVDGSLVPQPQPSNGGNTWRKRSALDGRIDWRMSATSVHNLVRALTTPYPGATCTTPDGEAIISKVEVVAACPENLEPGKVIRAAPDGVVVKCGEGAVRILEHSFTTLPKTGSYL